MTTMQNLKASLFAAGVLALSGAAHAQISDNVVRIGVMNDQSGPYAGNGGPGSVLAVRMAVEDFGGKVDGSPIEVLIADDQNKPDVGVSIARRWLEVDKVDAIVGGSASSIALGVNNLMREFKKPYLIAGTNTADLTGKACSPMNFQFVIDSYSMPKSAVQGLINHGLKTFYFITVDYAFGTALEAQAARFIKELGGKVVGAVKHPLGTTDFSSFLLQAQASKAQAIVLLNSGEDLSNALKQAAEYQIAKSGQVVTTVGMTINNVSALGLEVAQGLQFANPFYWDRDEDSRNWSRRFMARSNGTAPTYIMAGAYSAALHYLKAVAAAGTDEGVAVATKMKELPVDDFEMKNVPIRVDGDVMRPMYMVKVKAPSESKGPYDFYQVLSEIPADQVWRPLSEGGCDFVKAK